MKSQSIIAAALLGVLFTTGLHAQSTAFTYQGRFAENGEPFTGEAEFQFTLWDAATAGNQIAATDPEANVASVTNGFFTASLDFGATSFDGSPRWLEIGVATTGGASFTTLLPRLEITASPYAIKAASAATVDAGVISDPSFIGTASMIPLELFVNNQRALSLEQVESPGGLESVNIVAGVPGNQVAEGVIGATIAGGGGQVDGEPLRPNEVTGDFGTVSGGQGGSAGRSGVVAGGYQNTSSGLFSVVSGGDRNNATGAASVVAGGRINDATADEATVSGGRNNEATASFATVPGGFDNEASGVAGFGAGYKARAQHPGTFVWSDYQRGHGEEFFSTGEDQFLIRATGGVGIGQNAPAAPLHVSDGSLELKPFLEVVLVESADAVLGLYSSAAGSWGSAVVLAETRVEGALGFVPNKWTMARTTSNAGNANQLRFTYGTNSDYTQNDTQMRIDPDGNVRADGAFIGGGADVAESFDVEGSHADYEPGDVLAISTESDGHLVKSTESYSTLIAGVHATKPGVLLTDRGIDADLSAQVPLGVVGVIPTKVCLEGGPIQRGDLLVSSSTPGHAMKGDPNLIRVGTVLGKALEGFPGNDGGTRIIKVLVNVK